MINRNRLNTMLELLTSSFNWMPLIQVKLKIGHTTISVPFLFYVLCFMFNVRFNKSFFSRSESKPLIVSEVQSVEYFRRYDRKKLFRVVYIFCLLFFSAVYMN